MLIIFFINSLLYVILILLRIAFITLAERKILSFSQIRLAPNKNFFKGILQPVFDGLKLIFKQYQILENRYSKLLFLFPLGNFLFLLLFFISIPVMNENFNFFFFFLIVLIGLAIYFSLLIGFFSSSKYPFLARLRAISQSISYEISLRFLLFSGFFIIKRLNVLQFFFLFLIRAGLAIFPLVVLTALCILAEMNRAPFDFIERERELVSGFNTEFSRIGFTIIFLREYGFLIFYSLVFYYYLGHILVFVGLVFLFLLVRRVYPRFRYDKLMYFN